MQLKLAYTDLSSLDARPNSLCAVPAPPIEIYALVHPHHTPML